MNSRSTAVSAAWPPVHRFAAAGEATLVSTALPPGSHLVRLHPAPGVPYDRMVVVIEREGGSELFLSGWIGEPLTISQWRAAKEGLFPAAEAVSFERMRAGGMHMARLMI